jgi:hypothetical protein
MIKFQKTLLLCAFIGSALPVSAQNATPLLRDEVAALKKKLVVALDAMGNAPDSFTIKSEKYDLVTEIQPAKNGKWEPVVISVHRDFKTGGDPQKASQDISLEYQKKMADAQATGDYAQITKISLEMQQKLLALQTQAQSAQKDPISVDISANKQEEETIDPDNVVLEKPGLIALKLKSENEGNNSRIGIYLDPIALKNTRQLSSIKINNPDDGVSGKTTVLRMSITIQGPTADIEAWVKRISYDKILPLISGK